MNEEIKGADSGNYELSKLAEYRTKRFEKYSRHPADLRE